MPSPTYADGVLEAAPPPPLAPRDWLRPLAVSVLLCAALALVYLSPLRGALRHVQDLRASLDRFGALGPLVYMAGVWLLVAAGTPRLLFCPVGGLAFGFAYGLLWTQAATLAGCYTTFLFVRWGGRAFVLRRWPQTMRLGLLRAPPPALAVFTIRQLPVTGVIINVLLGVSAVRHRDFLLGTALGLLPQAVPATLLGSSALLASRWAQGLLLVSVPVLVALGLLLRRRARRLFARSDAAA
jgi:uncharacterized membrane protein YdjX (TVP38/TMEM64 family)